MTEETRKQKIQAVQTILDMLTQNPELPLPFHMTSGLTWGLYVYSKEDFDLFMKLAPGAELSQSGTELDAIVDMGAEILLEARFRSEYMPTEWLTEKTVSVQEVDLDKVRELALGT